MRGKSKVKWNVKLFCAQINSRNFSLQSIELRVSASIKLIFETLNSDRKMGGNEQNKS